MQSKFRILFITIIINCLLSIQLIGYSQVNDTVKVVVLSVNDQHAKIDNYGQFKALVDKIREENKYVLLFAAGDNFTGNPIVDMYEDRGYPIIDLMNDLDFNATAVGNHEFDYGQQILAKRIQQADFPFLSANIKDNSGRLKFKPYEIIKLDNGIKVGIFSAIQLGSGGIPDSHPSNLRDLTFTDGIEELRKFGGLRDSCDIFIALTHLGFEKDIELAGAMPQLDLILGGHTHTLTKPAHNANGVTIMQSGSGVRNLSKVTLFLVNNSIVKVMPEMLSISSFKESDKEINRKLEVYNDNKELNHVIGNCTNKLSGSDELGSMMTDAVTSLESVDIAFQNEGGIRIDYLNAGPITIKDVYKLDPFGNEVILIKMKAREIKSLIMNAYKDANNDIDLQVSGLTYTIITDNNKNAVDVDMRLPNGRKISKCRQYNVGLNSYIASSYKFEHKDPGKSLFITTAQTLINYLTDKKEVDYSGVKRVFVK